MASTAPLEIEEDEEASPSDGDFLSDTSSFNGASMLQNQHVYMNGRRYQGYRRGAYPLPNDDIEQNREALFHELLQELLDGAMCLAPIGQHPGKILDLGTGIGTWAIDMGDRFPEAEVLGVDLSAIQPSHVPPNVQFQIDDIEQEWIVDHDWGFIHIRRVLAFLRDPGAVIERAFAHLKPGGWMEMQEARLEICSEDETLPADSPLLQWAQSVSSTVELQGLSNARNISRGEVMERCGFVNIQKRFFKIPFGRWPNDPKLKRIGEKVVIITDTVLPTTAPHLQAIMAPEEIEILLAGVRTTLRDESVHAFCQYSVLWGQKPLGNSG